MIILDIHQKQPFDIIAMTPKGTLGLCCVHIAQLLTHPAAHTLPFTLQLCYKPLGILQRVNKSQNVHISSHGVVQKLHNIEISSHDLLQKHYNIDFTWHRSRGFLRKWVEKQEFPAFPISFFGNNQKLFLEFDTLHPIFPEVQGGSWASHTETHFGHSCSNENFRILRTSDLHKLANENHN